MRKPSLCFVLLLPFVRTSAPGQSTILMQPYLQAVTETSIEVLVESSATDPVVVSYAQHLPYTDSAMTTAIVETDLPSYVHRVRLTGLAPNTEYSYRVRQRGEYTSAASFRTAPPEGAPFRFAWMADCRTGRTVHDTICGLVEGADPVMLLFGGDLAATGSYESYKEDFFRPAELVLIKHVPFFNATGNHEGWTTNTRAFTAAPPSASGTEEYYSLDYGDLHVVVLNTQLPYGPGSPQYEFVSRDLAATKRIWKVVIAHRHAYCAGGHGENADLQRMASGIFEPDHVALVISGHSHFYQHNLVNGIHHLIIGSAGAPLYAPGSAWYTLKSSQSYNYAIGDVSPESLRLLVYDQHGAVLDSIVLRKPPSTGPDGGGEEKGAALVPGSSRPSAAVTLDQRPGTETLRTKFPLQLR